MQGYRELLNVVHNDLEHPNVKYDVLVWWCEPSLLYLPYKGEKQMGCPMDNCLPNSMGHLMRKRRVWICPSCDEMSNAWNSRQDFLDHGHDDTSQSCPSGKSEG